MADHPGRCGGWHGRALIANDAVDHRYKVPSLSAARGFAPWRSKTSTASCWPYVAAASSRSISAQSPFPAAKARRFCAAGLRRGRLLRSRSRHERVELVRETVVGSVLFLFLVVVFLVVMMVMVALVLPVSLVMMMVGSQQKIHSATSLDS